MMFVWIAWFVGVSVAVAGAAALWGRYQKQRQEADDRKRVQTYRPVTSPWTGKTFLVFVNPFGGKQKARYIFRNITKPMCDKAGIKCEVIETQRAGHAADVVREIDLSKYCGMLIISGDGLPFEIINALASRVKPNLSDPSKYISQVKEVFHSIPIGIIPAGSSNGVASSITKNDPFVATQRAIESRGRPMDIYSLYDNLALMPDCLKPVEPAKLGHAPVFDIMALNWGMIADFNEYMERKLRWAPDLIRLQLPPIFLMIRRRARHGVLRFLPVPGPQFKPEYKCSDHTKLKIWQEGPPSKDGEPWRVIDDQITLVSAQSLPYLAGDVMSCPYCEPDDGVFYIWVLRKISVINMFKVFLAIEHGQHVSQPVVEMYRCRAFSLSSDAQDLVWDASGEPISIMPEVSGVLHKGVASFLY